MTPFAPNSLAALLSFPMTMPEIPVPISVVEFPPGTEDLVLSVLRSGQIAQGPMVERLEHAFSILLGLEHVVAVSSGTAAIQAALGAVGLGHGDEVVTSPFTFVATLNAALSTGATVRFADISEDDFSMRPDTIETLLRPRTKVILPVHLFGQAGAMGDIKSIAEGRGIAIVEDAAQAHGATCNGAPVGHWGVGCFSLYATKNLTCGEGGLVATNDTTVAEHVRAYRNHGMRQRYEYEMVGTNFRLTDLQAALCLPQIAEYPRRLATRTRNADLLTRGLDGTPGLLLPRELDGRSHVWHQYTVLVNRNAKLDRNELAKRLLESGVQCGIYYPRPVFDYPCFHNHPLVVGTDVPVAKSVSQRCLSLPVHPSLSDSDLDRIIDSVRSLLTG